MDIHHSTWERWVLILISFLLVFLISTSVSSRMQVQGQVPTETIELDVYLPILLNDPTPTPDPVMHISGRVTKADGSGLANVEIYAGMFCRPPDDVSQAVFVAKTGPDGYYQGEINCPFDHDETFYVTARLTGYVFAPELSCWRTYGACPSHIADFSGITK